MTYEVYFKNGSRIPIENVGDLFDRETDFKFVDKEGKLLCFVNKSEYECILKVEWLNEKVKSSVDYIET